MGFITPCYCLDILAIVISLVAIVLSFFNWKFKYWENRGLPYLEPKIPFGNTINPLTRTQTFGDIVKGFYDEFKKRGLPHGGTSGICILVNCYERISHFFTHGYEIKMQRIVSTF